MEVREELKEDVEEFEVVESVREEVKEVKEGSVVVEADVSVLSEGLSEEYALSSTLPQEGGAEEQKEEES